MLNKFHKIDFKKVKISIKINKIVLINKKIQK